MTRQKDKQEAHTSTGTPTHTLTDTDTQTLNRHRHRYRNTDYGHILDSGTYTDTNPVTSRDPHMMRSAKDNKRTQLRHSELRLVFISHSP